MGEVYRALDTRLGREVAIKVLGPRTREQPGALQRFEQEARAASALNHPNIITLHDLGEEPTFPYLVMELVDGQSLRQMLRGPWPVELLLQVATQIAEGLVAAHERAIVHRDLKPENILVSREWVVKIVDFGLAQFRVAPGDGAAESREPSGAVQGTLGYLPPELLGGAPADPRSDQFSLGAILYEMAAGVPAFEGATSLERLARSVRSAPRALAVVRGDLPPALVLAIERCLRKDPRERFATTRELLDALRAVRTAAAVAATAATPPASRWPRATLPAPRTRLIGRERELAQIQRLLGDGVRLLTLTGPGGTGKTRLALRAAELLAPEMPGGVVFVPLGALTDPALVVDHIAQAMDLVLAPGLSALAVVVSALQSAGAPTLLLLDNFEQVSDAATVPSELLAACPALTIVVTSRVVLHLYGEHALPVPPLALPDPAQLASPAELSACPSVALFVERARAANAAFRLSADNASAVAELCAGLDGLPLALELAAVHTRVLPPEMMVARFDNRLELLSRGPRDLPGRQQTLRRTMEWSHQRLSEIEKATFRRLAAFAGGFTLEAAVAVVDPFGQLGLPVEEVVAALADQSLLGAHEPTDGEPRFSMLETVREYALEQLVAGGDQPRTQRAHAAYFLVLAEEGSPALLASDHKAWRRRFEREHDNFRAALQWATRGGEVEWGLRLALALFHFWEPGQHLAEGRRRIDELLGLEATRALPLLRARALFAAGVLASTQRDDERGRLLHQQCMELYRELGDRRGEVVALVAVANHHVNTGDHDGARRLLEESLRGWEELGDRGGFARSLSNLAFVARSQGHLLEARALYQRAATLFDELSEPLSRAWAIGHEGGVAREQGDLESAEALHRAALASFRQLGDSWGTGSSLADLGSLARQRGTIAAARQLFCEALASFVTLEHWRGIARVLESLACLAADEAEDARAVRLAAAAAALRGRVGAPPAPAVEEELGAALGPSKARLGPAATRGIWVEGAALSTEQAIRLATTSTS